MTKKSFSIYKKCRAKTKNFCRRVKRVKRLRHKRARQGKLEVYQKTNHYGLI